MAATGPSQNSDLADAGRKKSSLLYEIFVLGCVEGQSRASYSLTNRIEWRSFTNINITIDLFVFAHQRPLLASYPQMQGSTKLK
jgi:hypothetical protein